MPMSMPVDMLDDIEYYLTYPWSTLSYHTIIKSMYGCPAKKSNLSHTYSITGLPIAFMVWGYKTIPLLTEAFRTKSSTPICSRMRNWTISGMPNKNKLEDIFIGRGVVGVMVPTIHEMPLIATVHHVGGKKPYDIALIVEDKPNVDIDTERVHLVLDKIGLDEDDDQCFDEVGGEEVSASDAHRMCDQRIDHVANHPIPPVSISSSPIAESEHNINIFTQMSDKKLADSRRKRRMAKTIESSYNCQSLY
ncbi:hypothetical protein FNV43_RR24603 [Rhamnella rubrinervis]|uniref:Uncharacterized protein n=1 Tax=Rhamnella rubrinervis TaxID=2594499 RepID=A0A8K0DRH8_9ROSA|nr:hypothetical protein FNV43_RR24603 [Rhamnella rubrinervis]